MERQNRERGRTLRLLLSVLRCSIKLSKMNLSYLVEVFLFFTARFISLRKNLERCRLEKKIPFEQNLNNMNVAFSKFTLEVKSATKLARCLELIHETLVNISINNLCI